MTRKDVLREVSDRSRYTQKVCKPIMRAYVETIRDALLDDREEFIDFGGIGTFKVKHIKPRKGVSNLQEGGTWFKPAYDVMIFAPSRETRRLFEGLPPDDSEDDYWEEEEEE